MSYRNILLSEYLKDLEHEKMPLFRLDPSFIISFGTYLHELEKFRRRKIELSPLESLVKIVSPARFATRRLRLEKKGEKAFVLSARSIKSLAVIPIQAGIGYVPSKKYLVHPLTILFTETGSRIENVSILPAYLMNLVRTTHGEDLAIAATHHLIRGIVSADVSPYYVATLFSTQFGRLLINISTYGSVKPEINPEILKQTKLLRLNTNEEKWISETLKNALEKYEHKAWSAYMTANEITEKNLQAPTGSEFFSADVSFTKFKETGRLDPKFLLTNKMLESFERKGETRTVQVKDWFNVEMGTAPRNRKYRFLEGVPYVTFESIERSGIIDPSKFYHIPREELPSKMPYAKKNALLITCVAHDIRGIGKVGIASSFKGIPAMNGLAILNPRVDADPFYALAVLKSRLMKGVVQNLTYGLTAQVTKNDIEQMRLPIINSIREKVSEMIKTFLSNLHHARKLKREAVLRLESEISEASKHDKK